MPEWVDGAARILVAKNRTQVRSSESFAGIVYPVYLHINLKDFEMLVLSRQVGEKIMVGDDIELMIVAVRGDKVRLGIKAPRNVEVHRREIYDEIQKEKKGEKDKGPTGHDSTSAFQQGHDKQTVH